MHKLLLVEDINYITSGSYFIDYNKHTQIFVTEQVEMAYFSQDIHDLDIDLNDHSHLKFSLASVLNKDFNLNINLPTEATIEINCLFINEGHHQVHLTVNMLNSDNKANIKVRALNKTESSNLNIICDGNIFQNTQNNVLIEDLKGLILHNDTIKISPNMNVATNEVLANHLVTIGSFNQEELFYLQSKGLSLKLAQKLLIESFACGIIPNEQLKNLIKMEVKEIA